MIFVGYLGLIKHVVSLQCCHVTCFLFVWFFRSEDVESACEKEDGEEKKTKMFDQARLLLWKPD